MRDVACSVGELVESDRMGPTCGAFLQDRAHGFALPVEPPSTGNHLIDAPRDGGLGACVMVPEVCQHNLYCRKKLLPKTTPGGGPTVETS